MSLLNPKFIDEMRMRCCDPLLDLRFNPRSGRWIVVQDLSRSAHSGTWRKTSQDLVGVPGVNPQKCQLVRLFLLEDKGVPIVPNVEWIMRELHIRSRVREDDKGFEDVMAQEKRDEAEQRRNVRAKLTDDAEIRWALFRKKNYFYTGRKCLTGLS
mgnify:CR=1 FL=1